ncbi:uncharacterized protein K452DRAFT_288269 [Aplosporella prunicola CBS 121167]|uniref:Uncharacterized protein n=1 Tax=Aplosporella prunicola CBS 121167 TaxID=1176127 RepID=A0A6A6BA07_9PEZI|nr:uncharacterized protein K452DRAFT_288269 [Aplosporella prunicola CBS 121167]KAF2140866.1 hypothetical protein K452DRAFT_288269 [Aplosporella prunicola CBS 121167]
MERFAGEALCRSSRGDDRSSEPLAICVQYCAYCAVAIVALGRCTVRTYVLRRSTQLQTSSKQPRQLVPYALSIQRPPRRIRTCGTLRNRRLPGPADVRRQFVGQVTTYCTRGPAKSATTYARRAGLFAASSHCGEES